MLRLERLLVTAAAFVVVVAGLRAASAIVTPFLMAVFIATITAPLYAGLRARGISTLTALLVLMLALAAHRHSVANQQPDFLASWKCKDTAIVSTALFFEPTVHAFLHGLEISLGNDGE